jgi:thiamine biosynthesis lipoprotein
MMGTLVEVTVITDSDKAKPATNAVFEELKRIENLTSFHSDSELNKLNSHKQAGVYTVKGELVSIIAEALQAAKITRGAYDPTVGAITKLWRFSGAEEPRLPAPEEIKEALTKVGWENVRADTGASTIEFLQSGMLLDLGGISKGYALLRSSKILEQHAVHSALINIGGDILVLGSKEPGKPWKIGVQDPRNRGSMIASVSLENKILFTSGDYERTFEVDGKRYHHILDPKTGYPAEGTQSVTLCGSTEALLQPFGTAAFVKGFDLGIQLIESLEGTVGFIVDADGRMHYSKGAESIFHQR